MRARIVVPIVALVVVIGTIAWAAGRVKLRRSRPAEESAQLVVATTAKRQDLLLTVTQTGVVAAKKTTPVVPEISGRVQWACANGIIVSAGETVLRLDPTSFQERVTNLTVQYEEAVRSQTQADAVGKARMTETRLRLQRAEDDMSSFQRQQEAALKQSADSIAFDTAELEHRREDAEVTRRLAARGLVPGSDVERADAALKAAEFSVQRAGSDYNLKKSQAASDTLDRQGNVNDNMRNMSRFRSRSEREVRMGGNQVDNLKRQLDRAREDLTHTTLTAPTAGLVVLSAQGGWRGESRLPRLGDWVSQGREVAAIVSLDRMEVKLELDQVQIAGVSMGQQAEVTIEALPDKVLKGKVTAIGQTARRPPVQGWMGMSSSATFPVAVDLPPTGKALIRPGMHATIRIVSRRIKDAIIVPTGCIFRRDGHPVVFVERGGKFTPAVVTLGESNGDYTAITQGLKQGERIALNDLGVTATNGSRPDEAKERRP
jgi:HlyD family secretion protein